MRVLVVHNRYQSHHIGGEDLVVSREMRGLKAALGDAQVLNYEVCNDDISTHKLIFSLWGDKKHYHNIYHLVKKHKINIVHIHNFFPSLTPVVFKAAKDAGAKVVHTLHNFRWWCLPGILYRQQSGACERCVNKKIAWPAIKHKCYRDSSLQSAVGSLAFSWYQLKKYHHYIDAYFVLSEFQKNKVKQWLNEDKLWLKPNPIDFPENENKLIERQDYLFVGRLESAKGIDLLLSIWETLPEHFILNIIGSAEDDRLQQAYAKHNIRFLGKMPHEQTLEYLKRSKFFIHPSLTYETFGLTLVEALAHATPVIAIDCGPRREFVRSGFNGYLCEKEKLKETIMASQYTDNYTLLSSNAYESVKQFALPAIMDKQISFYKRIDEGKQAC